MSSRHDLVVIGAGPGGYLAAIRAAQLGLNVACVEKERALGGTCLRIGCIPSKALLESSEHFAQLSRGFKEHGITVGDIGFDLAAMLKRKTRIVTTLTKGIESLFKKNGVTRYAGHARFSGPGRLVVENEDQDQEIEAKHFIIATGSLSAPLKGVEVDGKVVGTSTEALSWEKVPEHLVVIGAGAIGLELGSVWRRLGAKVTVLEYLDRILPGVDLELAREAQKILRKQGFVFQLGARVTSATKSGRKAIVEIDNSGSIKADRVLLAVGRVPNTAGLALECLGIELDPHGRIPVGPGFTTSAEGVHAIGDVIEGPMLAHKAEEEGVACAQQIATGRSHVNYEVIPGVVYIHPEIASVGKTEEELKQAGVTYRKGTFPFLANGRARTLGETAGQVKILADKRSDRLLGVHILGPRAGDLISEAVVAMEYGASAEDLARTIHAHPTLPEAIKEAALAVDGRAIHI